MNFNSTETLMKSTLFLVFFGLITACGDSSEVGKQEDDLPPVAVATAIGLGKSASTTTKSYTARGNSEIVITGKDSFSNFAPIQNYTWQQTDSEPLVNLIELSNNAVSFTAPNVGAETEFSFQLTITDANGNTDTDELAITIIAVDDAGRFLSDPSTPVKELSILAALRGGESTGSSKQSFTLEVVTTAHWKNRLGEMDQLIVNTETISDSFHSNFSPAINYDPLNEPANPTIVIDLYPLDLDDINVNFQTVDRERRIDVYEAGSAYLDIQINIIDIPSVDFELFALNVSGEKINVPDIGTVANQTTHSSSAKARTLVARSLTRTKIDGKKLKSSVNASTTNNEALLQTWNDELTATLLTNNVLAALGLESSISANNYYALIDPTAEFSTLSAWLKYAGFEDGNGEPINDPAIAHAVYLNNYDLGFGRDMWLRKANDGNVYSYVINYPTVEAALQRRGEFATVVMEYSENPDPAGENEKIVKFYAYVPDERTGGHIRSNSMNFDGAGEKFLPGVCTACHQSNPGTRQYTNVSDADLNATFMPWDLDSFLYAHANDPKFIESTLDSTKFDAEVLNANSREAMEEQLRQLNLGALATFVDNPDRHATSIQLIHGWYGDENMELPIDQLPSNDFNGDFIQFGWQGQEELYHTMYARNCRICHTQIDNESTNFDSYDEFINTPNLINYVFEQGLMPSARLSLDRLWVSYLGGESSANILRSHLESLGNSVPAAPGGPVPRFTFSSELPTIEDQVTMDASNSVYAQTYSWSLVGPEASTATLAKLTGVSTSFVPDVAGSNFEVSLTITNENGVQKELIQDLSVANRAPIATCFNVDSANMNNSGLLTGIPIISNIGTDEDGDGGVTVDSMIEGNFGTVSIDTDGFSFSYKLFNPFERGVDNMIAYQLVDADGSLSTTDNNCLNSPPEGFGLITVDSSLAGLTPTNVLAEIDSVNNTFEANISWDPPTDVSADSYTLWRGELEIELDSDQQSSRSYTDSTLTYETPYSYTVRTVIDGFQSADSFPSEVTTASLVPTDLVGTSISSTQIDLEWSAPLGNVESYNIYRDDGTGSALLRANWETASYSDNDVSGNIAYDYVVTGFDSSGQESVGSNIASNAPKPLPPTNLTAVTASTSKINLSWPEVTDADSYKIYRKLSTDASFPATPIAEPGTNSYSDNTVNSGFTYDYQVGVTVGKEDSITFASASETAFPAAPNLLSAAVVGTSTSQIKLSWASAQGNISEYNVYRGETKIPTGSTNATYIDVGVTAGSQHSYTVTAVAGGHESAASVAGIAATFPEAPTGLMLTTKSTSQIFLRWTASSGNVDSYNVYLDNVRQPSTDTVSEVVTGLASYREYDFKVDATSNGLTSTQSATIAVTTDVSYANNIVSSIVTPLGCASSCHSGSSAQTTKIYIGDNRNLCLINNLTVLNKEPVPPIIANYDIGDCNSDMSGMRLSAEQFVMIRQWLIEGKGD